MDHIDYRINRQKREDILLLYKICMSATLFWSIVHDPSFSLMCDVCRILTFKKSAYRTEDKKGPKQV